MIAKLTGRVDTMDATSVVLDVQGVGYLVHCSAQTLRALPSAGEETSLAIETIIREDAFMLYGFSDAIERSWFRTLLTVQGVGARVGLAILSTLSPAALSQAFLTQDKTLLTRADGVGPKLAARLITELKDRLPALEGLSARNDLGVTPSVSAVPSLSGLQEDAISALVNLGYRRVDVVRIVEHAAAVNPALSLEDLLQECLNRFSRGAA